MKIIHIFNEIKFSGAEIMYADAAPVFRQAGYELCAVNTTENLGEYAGYFEKAGYRVFHRPYPSAKHFFGRWKYIFAFVRFLKREGFDAVHIHSQRMMFVMSLCARLANVRAVYTVHNVFRARRAYIYIYRFLTRRAAKYIFGCRFQTISDSVSNNEKNYFRNRTVKINNWYGNARFYPAAAGEKEAIRKELGITNHSPVIISVGGCSPVKRHAEIIKALAEGVIRQYPDAKYLHLGTGISLEEERALAEELLVAEHVMFCGNQTDVRKYLIASDIYVMTSLHEGSPITTIEAMACGIPVILYDAPGLNDFKENAPVIRPDYRLLAENITALYEDKEKRDELTERAKCMVNTQFDMRTNVQKIIELYQGK